MKIFIDCMKSKSVHSIYYKFIYLLSKLVIAKELCGSDYLKLKLNSSSLTGSNDIGKSNEVHYADDNNKLSNGSSSSSNFNNKDYLIKLKTLKDSTIHILNNKINELTDEVNFKESLQIKIINSSLSFFENNEYLTTIPNSNKVENDNNDNYIVDDDHDYASQNINDLQNYHQYNNVNNSNNNNYNNKEQNQNLSVISKVFQQNQSNHLHTNDNHHHDYDLKLETNRLIRRASMSFLKQRGSSKLSTLHEIQIIKDNNLQKLENFKLKLQQIIENFEHNFNNKTTVSSSSSSSSSVNAADSSTSPKTTTSSSSSSSPSLDTKKKNSINTFTIKPITNKSIDKLKLTLNISKSLSSDRKMHLTILKQHGEELLYNFHEELEIKMKNCFILCKNAIILRSDTLDSIESKIHIFLYIACFMI